MKICVDNLTKSIGTQCVLEGVNLELESGKVYGLYGKNGSGKTMLMKAIAGLIRPTNGTIMIDNRVLGKEMDFPENIGVLLENPAFLNKYSGMKNLQLLAGIKKQINDTDIRTAIEKVGLDPDDSRAYKKYSLGMKQKLGIACAVMEKPDIILLDEPFNALDESSVELVKALIREEQKRGALIIMACHDKDELEEISDKIIYIQNGRIKE